MQVRMGWGWVQMRTWVGVDEDWVGADEDWVKVG